MDKYTNQNCFSNSYNLFLHQKSKKSNDEFCIYWFDLFLLKKTLKHPFAITCAIQDRFIIIKKRTAFFAFIGFLVYYISSENWIFEKFRVTILGTI